MPKGKGKKGPRRAADVVLQDNYTREYVVALPSQLDAVHKRIRRSIRRIEVAKQILEATPTNHDSREELAEDVADFENERKALEMQAAQLYDTIKRVAMLIVRSQGTRKMVELIEGNLHLIPTIEEKQAKAAK